MSDKGALAASARFQCCPPAYGERVTKVLAHPGITVAQLEQTVNEPDSLWREIVGLAGTLYTPKYPLS